MADQYEVLEELGSGSFGVVYRGIEKATGEVVAIKHIDLESSTDDIEDIQQEIAVLSTCQSPFVTQYKTSFLRRHKLWIVMEYLGGGSCLDLLRPGPFSEANIAIICRELLYGLEYLHQEGKIHRDIKAANILLSQSGQVKLADFGVAAQLTNLASQRNTMVGTPFWMAPEVIEQAGYDFKADIWSLGVTAMELVLGAPPNASTHPMKVLFLIPKAPPPRLEGDRYSRDLRDFVAACLVKDPRRRPTAKELLQHRFVRRAGAVSTLGPLVAQRKSMNDARAQSKGNAKYYAESLNGLPTPHTQDDWVFETMRAAPHTDTMRKFLQQDDATATMKTKKIPVQSPKLKATCGNLVTRDVPPSPSKDKAGTSSPCTIRQIQNTRQTPKQNTRHSQDQSPSSLKQPLGLRGDLGNGSPRPRNTIGKGTVRFADDSTLVKTIDQDDIKDPADRSVKLSETTNKLGNESVRSADKDPSQLSRRQDTTNENNIRQDSAPKNEDRTRDAILQQLFSTWDVLKADCPEKEASLLESLMRRSSPNFKDSQAEPGRNATGRALSPAKSSESPNESALCFQRPQSKLQDSRRKSDSTCPPQCHHRVTQHYHQKESMLPSERLHYPGQVQSGTQHTKQLADVLFAKWTESLQTRWPVAS